MSQKKAEQVLRDAVAWRMYKYVAEQIRDKPAPMGALLMNNAVLAAIKHTEEKVNGLSLYVIQEALIDDNWGDL